MDTPHAVYSAFNSAHELLYVGCSARPMQRFLLGHRFKVAWFHELASVTFQWYPTRDEALAAEADAIKVGQPRYNAVHKIGPTTTCPKCGGEKEPGPAYCKACKRHVNRLQYLRARKRHAP